MIKFSIVIPLYNKERDILQTLNSVLKQTYQNFEVLLIDDGSTDNSAKVAKGLQDGRIRCYSKKNEGVGPTRNFGINKSTTIHIAFLDADDFWHPTHLEDLVTLIEKFPNNKWYATAYEKRFNDTLTTPLQSPVMNNKDWHGVVENYFENTLIDSIVWTSAVCFKKEFLTQLDCFDTSITNGAGEDTDLWIRAALQAPLAFCTTISARHNQDASNRISHTPTKNRVFFNPDNYNAAAEKDPYLHQYLDKNRYSLALQHKLAGDMEAFKMYAEKIKVNHLTFKQKYLLKLPVVALKALLKAKAKLEVSGIRLTSFK